MRIILYLSIFLSLLHVVSVSCFAAAARNVIRLAIFDNPVPDPTSVENEHEFVNSYRAGINTAITVAASKGVYITEKEFFHADNLASIIQQAANAKAWNPDIVIGLSTSNDFLMSKAFFSDQVILSISATDPAIMSLPPGFYSLGMPDTNAVNVIIKFIHKHYPNANLFITAAAESKQSVDFADLLAKSYKNQYQDKRVIQRKFLTEDINHLSFSKFMSGYQKGDVIIMMSSGYDSAIYLMNKITAHLKPIKPVFITSADNWGNSKMPQKISGDYEAFRIDTLSGDEDTKSYKKYFENYQKLYHVPPRDKISYVTYQAVMSFVEALNKCRTKGHRSTTKSLLLSSYLCALKNNKDWYRPPYYIVYKLENQNEIYFDKVS